jgi:hypothetical protein
LSVERLGDVLAPDGTLQSDEVGLTVWDGPGDSSQRVSFSSQGWQRASAALHLWA